MDTVLVGVFVLILLLPAICSFSQVSKNKSIDEQRRSAALPGFSRDGLILLLLGKDLKRYYDDHFGGREFFIACQLKIERALFPEAGPGYIIGRDGWFFSTRDKMIDNFLGYTKLPLRQLKAQQHELEERRDKLAARGIKYFVVIAPEKESVYPDYLPGWLKPSTTRTDQFVEYMRLHSTVEILDLRPVLRKAREHDSVFYKTDTHWNLMGAFVAYQAILSKLSNQIPGLAPLAATNFDIQRTYGTGGNLARSAGQLALVEDNMYSFTPKRQVPEQKFHVFGYDNNQSKDCQFDDWSPFGEMPVGGLVSLTTTNSQLTTQAVIFGDSFAFALTPFLGCHFGEVVTFCHQPFDPGAIIAYQPVLVIEENVEWLR
jgi:alginate O-acetyltransferase complex protein AlgJ